MALDTTYENCTVKERALLYEIRLNDCVVVSRIQRFAEEEFALLIDGVQYVGQGEPLESFTNHDVRKKWVERIGWFEDPSEFLGMWNEWHDDVCCVGEPSDACRCPLCVQQFGGEEPTTWDAEQIEYLELYTRWSRGG